MQAGGRKVGAERGVHGAQPLVDAEERRRVGDPAPAGIAGLEAAGAHQRADLRPAAVHDDDRTPGRGLGGNLRGRRLGRRAAHLQHDGHVEYSELMRTYSADRSEAYTKAVPSP